MKQLIHIALCTLASSFGSSSAQETTTPQDSVVQEAAGVTQAKLEQSLAELGQLQREISEESIGLTRELSALEGELGDLRRQYGERKTVLDQSTLDFANLGAEVAHLRQNTDYVASLIGDYIRNFESGLQVAEKERYRELLEVAKLAAANSNLTSIQLLEAQQPLLNATVDRLFEALGGMRFAGKAVDENGTVREGSFLMIGPATLFRSQDGNTLGYVVERLNSLEPTVVPFTKEPDRLAAAGLLTTGSGQLPLDPTLGNAYRVEEIDETLLEHIKKGGPIMIPIFVLAATALLVALYKWLSISFVRTPSQRQIGELLGSVAKSDIQAAKRTANNLRGPVGSMLSKGLEHVEEPKELMEEVMYETVLDTRLKLQRMLPFIALTSSSAPLLGLLGTVTGIMNTFTLMTEFGAGDVKTLSSGISEALITTEWGLYVAIPSLILYAFLSRKAKGVIDQMEKAAIAFVNQASQKFSPATVA